MTARSDMSASFGMDHQLRIYTAGLQGIRPHLPIAIEALEAAARELLSPEAYAYVAGGAGSNDTMRANLEAFRRWRIVPRVLRNVSVRDLSTRLLDHHLPAPLLLAPIGVHSIVHADAETAVARAASSLHLPFVLSTAASRTIEEVAAAMGKTPRLFQLYWSRDPEFTASLLSRAEQAGYAAIVVTLDTCLLGWREQDLQQAYLPFLQGQGLANYLSDPVFRAALSQAPEEDPAGAVRHFARIFSNPSLTWTDLAFLRQRTQLPMLLKGILHPDDAALGLEYGIDGIIVSNHGGRQVDGAIAALDALPAVVNAVQGRVPVLFDSGIRRGADAFKAIALGARAVLLGRPYMWGLALDGERGVEEVLRNFLADLDLTLGLSGHSSWKDVDVTALFESR